MPRHKYISLNSELIDRDLAAVPALSDSVLYGRGVFTTTAVLSGLPFLWPDHWQRLVRDLGILGMGSLVPDEHLLFESVTSLIEANAVDSGKARISLLSDSVSPIWGGDGTDSISVLINTSDLRRFDGGLKLGISPAAVDERSMFSGMKSCNYLDRAIPYEEARAGGFDEAVRLNRVGMVAGCCMANLFWVSNATGRLRTPGPETGCLPGTTRAHITREMDVERVNVGLADFLEDARSVFLTSAGLGARAAVSVGGKILEEPADELRERLAAIGLGPFQSD